MKDIQANFAPPRNNTEEMVARIWTQVLQVERIGIHDNFFELGGHSVLATQVISRILKSLQEQKEGNFSFELEGILLGTVFEQPTVASMAQCIEAFMDERVAFVSNEEEREEGEI